MIREQTNMITNERQFRISRAQLEKFRSTAGAFDHNEAAKRSGSPILARAEQAALQSQIEELAEKLREYEALQSGTVSVFKADSLSALPRILIQARIARGLSQRDLAGKLDLKEQQIQRYESEEYATASLRRLAEVAKALNLNITESAEFGPALPSNNEARAEKLKRH
jgi:HTH-type transcriptional regulator/antitoxin HigA